jgi:L-lactate dehydrogenase
MIARHVNVNPKNVHAYVFGEHGDSSMVPWSLTSVGGIPLRTVLSSLRKKTPGITDIDRAKVEDSMHRSGGEIIRLKGATYYAIAVAASKICRNILRNTNSVMTLSGMLHGEYGFDGICMSIPFILNREGIGNSIAPPLQDDEMEKLRASAGLLKNTIEKLDL